MGVPVLSVGSFRTAGVLGDDEGPSHTSRGTSLPTRRRRPFGTDPSGESPHGDFRYGERHGPSHVSLTLPRGPPELTLRPRPRRTPVTPSLVGATFSHTPVLLGSKYRLPDSTPSDLGESLLSHCLLFVQTRSLVVSDRICTTHPALAGTDPHLRLRKRDFRKHLSFCHRLFDT